MMRAIVALIVTSPIITLKELLITHNKSVIETHKFFLDFGIKKTTKTQSNQVMYKNKYPSIDHSTIPVLIMVK